MSSHPLITRHRIYERTTGMAESSHRVDQEVDEATTGVQLRTGHPYAKPPKLRKFDGEGDIDEFVKEVLLLQRINSLGGKTAASWVLDALEGTARRVILDKDPAEIDSAPKILELLQEQFEKYQSPVIKAREFFKRMQGRGETIPEFADALYGLWKRVNEAEDGLERMSPDTLCAAFTEGLRTPALKRNMKQLLRDHPNIPFRHLVREAKVWMREEQEDEAPRIAAQTCKELELTARISALEEELKRLKMEKAPQERRNWEEDSLSRRNPGEWGRNHEGSQFPNKTAGEWD